MRVALSPSGGGDDFGVRTQGKGPEHSVSILKELTRRQKEAKQKSPFAVPADSDGHNRNLGWNLALGE